MTERRRRGLRVLWPGLAAAAASLAAQVPPHPSQIEYPAFEFRAPSAEDHRIDLPGGHVAFLVPDPTWPLVDVAVALEVGSFLDPPDRAGLALITGALLRRGGTESLTPDDFDERVDRLGAELDSHFGELRGGLSLSVPSWELDAGLDLLFDAIFQPRFDAERLADVRANALEGIGRRNVEPLDVLEREWQWLLYGASSFLTQPLTAVSVGAIEREEILAFHRRHVAGARLIWAVAGDVTREEIESRLASRLADHAAHPSEVPWPPPPPDHRPQPGLYLVDSDTPQAKVLLGHRATAPEKGQRAAVRVLGEILGGSGAISRIAGRLRTAEGLVYRASASIDVGDPWPRDFRVFFETTSSNVPRAVAIAIEEIRRLRTEPPHPRELAVVQRSVASSIRLSFDTAEKAAGWLARDEILRRPPDTTAALYRGVRNVTREEVRQAAIDSLDPDQLIVLIVGRASELLGEANGPESALELALGRRAIRLPARDPLTLQPLEPGSDVQP